MKAPSRRDRIRAQLADLKMPGALEALDQVLSGIDGGSATATGCATTRTSGAASPHPPQRRTSSQPKRTRRRREDATI